MLQILHRIRVIRRLKTSPKSPTLCLPFWRTWLSARLFQSLWTTQRWSAV